MAQGTFGGSSRYDNQTLGDIVKDIKVWIRFCEETLLLFNETILKLKENNYYDTVPFNLRALFEVTTRDITTFISDFNSILSSISEDKIYMRDVRLLKNIGTYSIENNNTFGRVYHASFDDWIEMPNHSDINFKAVERLYGDGRDLFVTLMDASNAAERLRDYMSNEHQKNQQVIINGHGNQVQAAFGDNNEFVMELADSLGQDQAEQLNMLLAELKQNLNHYFAEHEEEKKETTKELIDGLREEITKEHPKKGMVRACLSSLNSLSTSADFVTIVSGITSIVGSLPFMK
ncbi:MULTISPECIES: hypothetical protein [Exiguobacterium]|uniref:hypothetical protein n=1 Tax=Exiguobacterium TaxID=33986 RepID=UPI00210F1671|nr:MULTISPECIES: hypothetical protein [Exiguobacterium]MCQ4090911.1 hypothetical protein [Exiguobacterium sp. LL15]